MTTTPAQAVAVAQLRRLRWAVRATLTLGVAASVAANILHARPNPISQVIAAWPPLALLLTVELISRIPTYRRSLGFVRVAATAGIAGIAAWVSYHHMAAVAARYGETGASPYLLPLSVDGLVIVASISLVELAGRIRVDTSEHHTAPPPAPAQPEPVQIAPAAPVWRPPAPTSPASSGLPPAPRPVPVVRQAARPASPVAMPTPDLRGGQPAAGAASRNEADREREAQVRAASAVVALNGSGGAAPSRTDPLQAPDGRHAQAHLAERIGARTLPDHGTSASVAAPTASADPGRFPAPSPRPEALQAPPGPSEPTDTAPTVHSTPPAAPEPDGMPVSDTHDRQRAGDASDLTGAAPESDVADVVDAGGRAAGQVVNRHDTSAPTGVFDTPPDGPGNTLAADPTVSPDPGEQADEPVVQTSSPGSGESGGAQPTVEEVTDADDPAVPSETAAAVAYWHRRDPNLHPAQIGERIGRSERTVRRYWPPVQADSSTGLANGNKADHRA